MRCTRFKWMEWQPQPQLITFKFTRSSISSNQIFNSSQSMYFITRSSTSNNNIYFSTSININIKYSTTNSNNNNNTTTNSSKFVMLGQVPPLAITFPQPRCRAQTSHPMVCRPLGFPHLVRALALQGYKCLRPRLARYTWMYRPDQRELIEGKILKWQLQRCRTTFPTSTLTALAIYGTQTRTSLGILNPDLTSICQAQATTPFGLPTKGKVRLPRAKQIPGLELASLFPRSTPLRLPKIHGRPIFSRWKSKSRITTLMALRSMTSTLQPLLIIPAATKPGVTSFGHHFDLHV
mmetsp:Transcript_8899/g.16370  ORF Transcript_8899/g.16370 Transcript_8899/m.16370 type:complete len:293 (+) Transcript_8899:2127-3005(+)